MRNSTKLINLLLTIAFLMSRINGAMAQQIFTQLNCRITIERDEETVSAAAIIESSKPTRADYTLRALMIDAAGSGTSEQSGSINLQPGEPMVTSRVEYRLAPTGWIEFHLRVTERLTSTSCDAEEIVSPM